MHGWVVVAPAAITLALPNSPKSHDCSYMLLEASRNGHVAVKFVRCNCGRTKRLNFPYTPKLTNIDFVLTSFWLSKRNSRIANRQAILRQNHSVNQQDPMFSTLTDSHEFDMT